MHKVTVEALERLLLCQFENATSTEVSFLNEANKLFKTLIENPNSETLKNASENEACKAYFDAYQKFKESVRTGKLGQAAQCYG